MTNTLSTTTENARLAPGILFASANTSAYFALQCLESTADGHLNAIGYTPPPGQDFEASIEAVCALPGMNPVI